jgi:hypothetical protein
LRVSGAAGARAAGFLATSFFAGFLTVFFTDFLAGTFFATFAVFAAFAFEAGFFAVFWAAFLAALRVRAEVL